jgi:hypothetical protein
MLEDNLERLTDQAYQVAVSRSRGRWRVELYGENDSWEMGGTRFDGKAGGDLDELLWQAREWTQTPLAKDLGEREWLRLCQAAARQGVSASDLIREGTRELLDRICSDGETVRTPRRL